MRDMTQDAGDIMAEIIKKREKFKIDKICVH